MISGQSIKFLKALGSPLGPALNKVAAALTCGCKFAKGSPLLDTAELVNGEIVREHTWSFDGDQRIEFKPDFEPEKIEFNELVRRLEDPNWCEANKHHPIAYLRAFIENKKQLVELLKNRAPLEKHVRSSGADRAICLIPHHATDTERAEMLKEFNRY